MQAKTLRYITLRVDNPLICLDNAVVKWLNINCDIVIFKYAGRSAMLSPIDLATLGMRVAVFEGRVELNHHIQHESDQFINMDELDTLTNWSPPIHYVLKDFTNKLKDLWDADSEANGDTQADIL